MRSPASFSRLLDSKSTRWRQDREFVRAAQSPKAVYLSFAHGLSQHPVMLSMLIFGWIAEAIQMFPATFPNLSLGENCLILGVSLTAYCCAFRLWFGHWLYWCIQRNIPLLLICCGFWSIGLVIFNSAGALFIDTSDRSLIRFTRQFCTTNVLAISFVFAIASAARTALANRSDAVPVFWPVRAPKLVSTNPQALQLDADIDGDLRWIVAYNKGITVVTTAGEAYGRQTLQEAVDTLDPDLGWHCHRSLWVAKAEVAQIIYLKGNPRLEMQCGQLFPIRRAAVGPIRDHLRQRSA